MRTLHAFLCPYWLIALGLFVVPRVVEAKRPPNIIHIIADDVGYDDLSCFGAQDIRTPNLDYLAASGRRFTSFYSPSPFCSASRAAAITGCYADRIGIPMVLFPYSKIGLHADETTVAEMLKPAGYDTALIGKWHLGHRPEFLPTRHGFDHFYGIPYPNDHEPERRGWSKQAGQEGYIPPPMPLYNDETVVEEPADLVSLPHRFTVEAVRFIRERRSMPFFLHFANVETHTPWFTSGRFTGVSKAGPYGDAVRSLDWSVGQIIATLADCNLLDDTLIVFHSDNGYLPEQSNNSDLPDVYGPYATVDPRRTHILRGGKGTIWEGGVRVSCIMSWRGKIPAGTQCDEVAASFDLVPTFVKLAGGELPAERILDGRDIAPLMRGDADARSPHEALYYYHGGALGGVRRGNWKLLFPGVGRGGKGAGKNNAASGVELYDLASDLGETKNVSADHPDVVKELEALAEKARDDIGDVRTRRQGKNTRPVGMAMP